MGDSPSRNHHQFHFRRRRATLSRVRSAGTPAPGSAAERSRRRGVKVFAGKDPGFRVERAQGVATLVMTGRWSKLAERVLDSGRADGLELNYAKGFKDTDLAFIRPWPLKRLAILARTIKDVTPIYALSPSLESLRVECAPTATIDLARLPSLRSLSASWAPVRSSIGELAALDDLFLLAYSEVDLHPLRSNSRLVRLRFKDRPRLRSLAGLEALQAIEHLGIYLAPLHDITALEDHPPAGLRELHLESCRVSALTSVAAAQGLRHLNMSDCGGVESLRPLCGLGHLESLWLYGTTKVLDDDLMPIADLPRLRELRMMSRKSYRPSVEDLQTIITNRAGL